MISNYVRTCTKNIAGSSDKVFITEYNNISGLTWSGTSLSDVTMHTGQSFAVLQTDLDSVNYTSNGTAQRGYFSEQNLIMRFSKKSPELEQTVEGLLNGSVCGLVAFRIDGLSNVWVSGVSPVDQQGGNRAWMQVTEEFDGGASIEDSEEGNAYTITLARMSATREFPVTNTLKESILEGTAAFINW